MEVSPYHLPTRLLAPIANKLKNQPHLAPIRPRDRTRSRELGLAVSISLPTRYLDCFELNRLDDWHDKKARTAFLG